MFDSRERAAPTALGGQKLEKLTTFEGHLIYSTDRELALLKQHEVLFRVTDKVQLVMPAIRFRNVRKFEVLLG